jgi:hypothetical protein
VGITDDVLTIAADLEAEGNLAAANRLYKAAAQRQSFEQKYPNGEPDGVAKALAGTMTNAKGESIYDVRLLADLSMNDFSALKAADGGKYHRTIEAMGSSRLVAGPA